MLFMALLAAFPVATIAGDFNVKEYEIGMPISRHPTANKCYPDADGRHRCFDQFYDFTIGGEKVKNVIVFYDDEKAEQIYFQFDSSGFNGIKAAIIAKYKKPTCKLSEVGNAMGAKFVQEICAWKTKNESMYLAKYSGNISEGDLLIVSKKEEERSQAAAMAKQKDL